MIDRVSLNSPDPTKLFGPIDELFVTGCDVHMEQMSEQDFVIIITRGDETMHIAIYAPGRGKCHAKIEVDDGFTDVEKGPK